MLSNTRVRILDSDLRSQMVGPIRALTDPKASATLQNPVYLVMDHEDVCRQIITVALVLSDSPAQMIKHDK